MQKETKAIGFACCVGMFLGSVAALECARHFHFSWRASLLVGLVVGGTLGYVCQDLQEFASGVARAWRRVGGWRPNRAWWGLQARFVVASFCMGSVFGFYLSLFFEHRDPGWLSGTTLAQFVGLVMLIVGAGAIAMSYFLIWGCEEGCCRVDQEAISWRWLVAKHLSPPFVVFWVCYGTFRATAWAVPRVPTFFRFVGRFLGTVGRYVHSSRRTLCLVDSCIGVAVTFCTNGSPLVYAIVGAVCSMIHYELVSVRWLHLPQKAM